MGVPLLDSARAGQVYLGYYVPPDVERPKLDTVTMREVMHVARGAGDPPLPVGFGHGLTFGLTGWGMDGNGPADRGTLIPAGYAARQGCGDCTAAAHTHAARQDYRLTHKRDVAISDWTTVQQYAELTGYDPRTGEGDNGTDPLVALQYARDTGWRDDDGGRHKLGAIVTLEPGNRDELLYAAWLFEKVFVAVQFQSAQMDQFDRGQPWDYVEGSPIEGGHEVLVESKRGLITWGHRTGLTEAWYTQLNQESFSAVGLDQFNSVTGKDAEGYREVDVERYVHDFVQGATHA